MGELWVAHGSYSVWVFSLWPSSLPFHSPPEKVPIYTLPQFGALYPTQELEADSRKWLSRTLFGTQMPFSNKLTKDSLRGVHLFRHAWGCVLLHVV